MQLNCVKCALLAGGGRKARGKEAAAASTEEGTISLLLCSSSSSCKPIRKASNTSDMKITHQAGVQVAEGNARRLPQGVAGGAGIMRKLAAVIVTAIGDLTLGRVYYQ